MGEAQIRILEVEGKEVVRPIVAQPRDPEVIELRKALQQALLRIEQLQENAETAEEIIEKMARKLAEIQDVLNTHN